MKTEMMADEKVTKLEATRSLVRFRVQVRGVVQGVGFRPWIYRLAQHYGLCGYVLNHSRGVILEVEGNFKAVDAFMAALSHEVPPLAQITELTSTPVDPLHEATFTIRDSGEEVAAAFTLIPPDICVCQDCLEDIRDPGNRRFGYPFTNCTNCGPRYSIILDVPYDRPATTMADFSMCPACHEEYLSSENRRFHAQPNACPACGPQLTLANASGEVCAEQEAGAILQRVAELLLAGNIVAWKGLGGYQLACDARNEAAVNELRRRKHRNQKPFAVMVKDVATAAELCLLDPCEAACLQSPQRPIVLLRRRQNARLAAAVSPGVETAGVMLPSTPMHDLLFQHLRELAERDIPLVMTSGNRSEEPIVIDNDEAERDLAGVADWFVHHNRRIHTRVDDSVVHCLDEVILPVRRARGYTPQPLWLGLGENEVLACGAQQKNTLCLTKAGFALPSQHLGDLENYETLEFFEQTLARMQQLFHVQPTVVAYDPHPGYLSTQFALRQTQLVPIAVQHHHAHIAACMAEHGLRQPVIGVAWDGTGLGTDHSIWGGEFLIADLLRFERVAHLRTVRLIGGDAGIREPWRMARSYLRDVFSGEVPTLPVFASIPEARVRLVDSLLRSEGLGLSTSSAGRLFDAVAAIIGLYPLVSYEGQAAIAFEALTTYEEVMAAPPYLFDISSGPPMQLDFRRMIRAVVEDHLRLLAPSHIAARCHATLVVAIVAVCLEIRRSSAIEQVCLSGGCFQNLLLLRGCIEGLRAHGFTVYFPQKLPVNDGGISFGQAAVACATLQQGA